MGKTAILAIKIVSDASKAPQGFEKTSNAAQRMEQRTGRAARVARVGLLGLGAASVTAAKNAAKDADAQALLAKAMRNVGQGTRSQVKAMEDYIAKTSAAVGVSDDQLRPALGTLVRATGSAKTAQKELNAALDVSAATGKPVEQVANAIAKAHSGQTSALSRLVPGIDQAAIKSKDMKKIMAELARTTGGDAATAANTAEGKMRRMSLSFDEASESLGVVLIPALAFLATTLAQVGTFMQNNTRAVQIAAVVLGGLALSVMAINAAYKVYSAYTKAAAAAQWLFNAAMSANPLALVVIAVIAVGVALVVAYKKSATFRNIVQATGRAGKAAIGWVVDKAKSLWQWLGKLGPAMNKGKEIAKTAFKVYTTPIRTVIQLVQKLVGWIKKIKFPSVPKGLSKLAGKVGLGGPGDDRPRPPAFPGGGRRGNAGGAGGPSGAGAFTFGIGGGRFGGAVVINIYGAVDAEGTARQLRRILFGSDVRNGRRR